jgi:hypothetical protein
VGPGDPSKAGNFHAPDPADGANTKTNMSLLTGLERTSVFANGGFSITDDLRIVADALYSKRESTKHLAGYPYSVSAAGAQRQPCRPVQGQRVQPVGPGRAVLAPHRGTAARHREQPGHQARQHRPGRQLRNRFAVLGLERQLHVQPQ